MKLILALLGTTVLMSCGVFKSTTYIDPANSFVLGQGMHGGYSAEVFNSGNADVEIFQNDNEGMNTSLGILKQGSKSNYKVKPNTTLRFKNLSETQAMIKIKLRGDTELSMGYESR